MNDLTFEFEWIDPLGAKGPELRATWARLSITANGYPITKVYDECLRSGRNAVYLPLYPLAEWLAEQWWPLWNEPSSLSSVARPAYDQRHSLIHAREGYALPPLSIEPAGSHVLLSWSDERLSYHRLEFQGRGEVWLETQNVMDQVSSLIAAVVGRLDEAGITDTQLQHEWLAIREADTQEKTFCEFAGSLGLDPYALDETQQQEIKHVGDILPEEIVPEFFRAARPREDDLREDAEQIQTAIDRVKKNTLDLAGLKSLHDKVFAGGSAFAPNSTPWEQGYSFARQLRDHLGLDGTPLKSMEDIEEAIGLPEGKLNRALIDFSSREIPFLGLVGTNSNRSPAFVIRQTRPTSTRFHFCRALFEYLCSPHHKSALITDVNTVQQKRNRAFAAEFLAPAAALRKEIKTPAVTRDQTEEIADQFGVSPQVIDHQLTNHRIATIRQE